MVSVGGSGGNWTRDGESSGIGVVARLVLIPVSGRIGVGLLPSEAVDVDVVAAAATREDVPRVERGRALEEARLAVPETRRWLCLPPREEDEVEPARSREKGGEGICGVDRDGTGEGGAGRVECN